MKKVSAWLLDVFEDWQSDAVVLWLLTTEGERLRLRQAFPVCFFASGSPQDLRNAWKFLAMQPNPARLSRTRGRDLFQPEPLDLLAVEVASPALQAKLFRALLAAFPQLAYYDADISLPLRHAARYNTFPLCRCQVEFFENGLLDNLMVENTCWQLDPPLPPLSILEMEPDCDPQHAAPRALLLRCGGQRYRLSLHSPRPLLISINALLKRYDPDVVLTRWGDTWLLPHLFALADQYHLPLLFNRESGRACLQRAERSYFSYGQVMHSGQQIHLFGRWHIDQQNAIFWREFGMDGILEMACVTAQPVQVAARTSPGTGISSMQVLTALRQNILVPWHKQQAEQPKTALDLIQADLGGLIYQPVVGLHGNVGAIDFVSMYPAIMVRCNISPETGKPSLLEDSPQPPGLIPLTLAPLLEKRVTLKQRLGTLPKWDPRYKADKARSTAHKWLLVTCFGYLGYKNARFGRIEAHEAVTAGGREALLRAKEAAEDLGFRVLHMYVDGIWIFQPGYAQPDDFQELLHEVVQRTGLAIALEGVYRWVAFLPSRLDARIPVPNRYFGVFQDGSLKVRGLEARRRDTCAWVAGLQMRLLEHLAQAPTADDLPAYLPTALAILRRELAKLNAGQVPLPDLLVALRLSREPQEYKTLTPGARAALQLQQHGKNLRPGQRVRLLYLLGGRVHAWDLPEHPKAQQVDHARYYELALRAASALFMPLGLSEVDLRAWLRGGIQLSLPALGASSANRPNPERLFSR